MALAIVFLLAAIQKVIELRQRSVRWHPLIIALPGWGRRHAGSIVAASAACDTVVFVLLLREPRLASLGATALLLVYSALGLAARETLKDGARCRCMWRVLEAETLVGLLFRNLCLLGLAAAVLNLPGQLSAISGLLGLGLLIAIWSGVRIADGLKQDRGGWFRRSYSAQHEGGSREW